MAEESNISEQVIRLSSVGCKSNTLVPEVTEQRGSHMQDCVLPWLILCCPCAVRCDWLVTNRALQWTCAILCTYLLSVFATETRLLTFMQISNKVVIIIKSYLVIGKWRTLACRSCTEPKGIQTRSSSHRYPLKQRLVHFFSFLFNTLLKM